jgi:glycosyltransferase involved in cell wall biosynthesis
MIIGIDGNEANIKNRVGVNTYAYELLKNMAKLQDSGKNDHKLIVYLKNDPLNDMPEQTANFKYKIIPGGGMWILTKLMPRLIFNSDKLDVFFSPSHYLPPLASMPRICSIMDLGYLEFSEQFTKKVFWQLRYWSAISIYVSKAVIAISNSTKRDIVRHYPFAEHKTYVTHLAYDVNQFNKEISEKDVRRVLNKYSIVDDYVLYLGTLKPSKNIEGLIAAFQSVITNYQLPVNNLKLVIAGKKGWMFDTIYKKAKDLGLSDKIVYTDFIPEEDKAGLIAGAKVFVLPSFWEGFGLDALNTMASGVPVVASNVGSLPEVVGEAGIMVDPNSIDSIAEGIASVLSATKLEYNSIVEKGFSQVSKFTWEETAKKTLEIIENVH